ncbi:hypothetical protein [Streptomyces griseus]|uniref:hypothetical protein n=1 Tax=Streptomyces griseus TaxID=1911 RepID=UPI000840558C
MARPLTRVLTLLELPRSDARLTGTELADRLDTDVRTERRYTAHLRGRLPVGRGGPFPAALRQHWRRFPHGSEGV